MDVSTATNDPHPDFGQVSTPRYVNPVEKMATIQPMFVLSLSPCHPDGPTSSRVSGAQEHCAADSRIDGA
jgi:hypothetical protein